MTGPLSDVYAEGRRVLDLSEDAGVAARALGGVAIRIRVGERLPDALAREAKDVDLATTGEAAPALTEVLTSAGYEPNKRFNALHGGRRMLFYDTVNSRQLDVFVDTFDMCHSVPLTDRLLIEPHTLPLAELLMTKLQVVELNEKDRTDLYALLHAHAVASTDGDAINADRIATVCADDWGLWRTFQLNFGRLRDGLATSPLGSSEREAIETKIAQLQQRMEAAPKSRRWKLRARVGDRVRWYREPDEVGEG